MQQATSLNSQQSNNDNGLIVGPSDHYGTHYEPAPALNDQLRSADNNTQETSLSIKIANFASQQAAQQVTTRVYVIVDSRVPVMFKLNTPPACITLGDLKAALPAIDQPNFKYFFKSKDSEFGTVKEEIQDDDCKLPTDGNRVSVWIVTPGKLGDELVSKATNSETCNLTYTSTSYDDGSSSLMTTDMESTSYFTETDDNSTCCSDYSETTCDTFVSQRNNRHYKNGHGGPKSPTHLYGVHDRYHNTRSPHRYHDRTRSHQSPSSSSSTSSSASRSDATAVHCLTVHLVLTNENFLGLHIYANAYNGIDEGIYVDGVTENSAVALDGRIEPGDKLIQVNEVNLEELSNEEAVEVLKEAVLKRGPLKLVVAKFVENNKNDEDNGIMGPREAIHPIDTAAWVAHAQAITIPNSIGGDQVNSTTSSPSFDSNAQDTDCIRPASASIANMGSGLRLNRRTTDMKEIIQHMKIPEIGLDIKNREWLKITIRNAFLGSELVKWLERNVYGFDNNREAKKFASRMLKEGYIRDPISNKPFSSKSYYTFVI